MMNPEKNDRLADTQIKIIEEVKKLNENYAWVSVGGKSRILQWMYDYNLKKLYPYYIEKTTFIDGFANQKIVTGKTEGGKPKYKALGNIWFEHPLRATYLEGVYFEPMVRGNFQKYPNRLNMWTGYAIEPEEGNKHQPILSHLCHIVCEGNNEYYHYLIKWIAWVLQHPNQQPEVAVILRGGKGTGKGIIGRLLKDIFGRHGLHLTHASHLVGKFNAHLADCAFIFSDEATYAGDKQGEQVLKGLVTEPTFTVERKGIDIVTEKNNLAILMATNHEWAIPSSRDERRYFILNVEQKNEKSYFAQLITACDAGKSNFLYFCLNNIDLSGFHPRVYPETDGNRQQREHSLEPFPQFLLDACERGYLIESIAGINKWHPYEDSPSLVSINLIHEAFEQWGHKSKRLDKYNVLSARQIIKYLNDLELSVQRLRNAWDYSKNGTSRSGKQTKSVHLGKPEELELLIRNFEKL